jgi:hypothetical protein
MLQESASVDLTDFIREPSTSFKFYVLFLLVACVVGCAKLARIWRAAPPFRLSRLTDRPTHLRLLQESSRSLTQWIGCIFLAWGVLTSTALYGVCNNILTEKTAGRLVILYAIEDFSASLGAGLWVVIFLFLVRWHALARIDRMKG